MNSAPDVPPHGDTALQLRGQPLHTEVPVLFETPLSVRIVDEVYARMPAQLGTVSNADARFICSLLQILDARLVAEVGVAAGGSSFTMLTLFDALGGDRHLFAFDILPHYYADPSKPVGFMALESGLPTLERYHLFPGEGASFLPWRVSTSAPGQLLDVAFIDAHHSHPWPALDMLATLPAVKPGGWIMLHDINLSVIAGHELERGPSYLFARWGGERVRQPGSLPNIGAVQTPDPGTAFDWTLDALELPWEFSPGPEAIKPVVDLVAPLMSDAQRARLFGILAAQAGWSDEA
ncbi:MAG: class I SAM-dependent methyltransferase [Acetobacteraceae bacterium]|nr:class I SAM-dependent methyltransferase [Acetobacteraceae bacterium]